MPLVAQWLIMDWGWRQAWRILGLYTLIVGVVPAVLLLVRRPEDMGLSPDAVPSRKGTPHAATASQVSAPTSAPGRLHHPEVQFTLRQALRTRAFWMLAAFSATGFMAQAGVSLHQVSHYVHQGLTRPAAAVMASIFAIAQVPAGLLWSTLTRRFPIHDVLALAGLAVAVGAAGTAASSSLTGGSVASAILGGGVGGLHMLLRLAWAEYYGRHHLGTIQGVTLPVQLVGQALGPVTAGFVFDVTGAYHQAFFGFAGVVLLGSACVLTATPPGSSEDCSA